MLNTCTGTNNASCIGRTTAALEIRADCAGSWIRGHSSLPCVLLWSKDLRFDAYMLTCCMAAAHGTEQSMRRTAPAAATVYGSAGSKTHIGLAVALAHELADVDLAAFATHVREARVADMRVVRPDNDLRLSYAQVLLAGTRAAYLDGLQSVHSLKISMPERRACPQLLSHLEMVAQRLDSLHHCARVQDSVQLHQTWPGALVRSMIRTSTIVQTVCTPQLNLCSSPGTSVLTMQFRRREP